MLIFILYRQRQVRPPEVKLVLPVVLVVLGAVGLVGYLRSHPISHAGLVLLAVSIVADAAGLGAIRAGTVRLWTQDGQSLRQGSWLTVALWLVGVAIHVVLDNAAGTGSQTVLLYLGVTLAAQRLALQARVQRTGPGRPAPHLSSGP